MRKLFNDEAGFIISAELMLVLTIGVLGTIVGLVGLRDALASEMADIASAFGAINQTFNFKGISKGGTTGVTQHGVVAGAGFNDKSDDCDCTAIMFADVTGKTDTSGGTLGEGN